MGAARIVVIDDSTSDVNLLRIALDAQGEEYQFETLHTGEEAMQFIRSETGRASEREPCVIVIDLHLQNFDGLAILRAVRESTELSHVRVVMLSGLATPAQQEQIAGMGAVYAHKPLQLDEFMELGARIMAICLGSLAAAAD